MQFAVSEGLTLQSLNVSILYALDRRAGKSSKSAASMIVVKGEEDGKEKLSETADVDTEEMHDRSNLRIQYFQNVEARRRQNYLAWCRGLQTRARHLARAEKSSCQTLRRHALTESRSAAYAESDTDRAEQHTS